MNKSEHYQKYADYTAIQAVNTGFGWMPFLDTMATLGEAVRSVGDLVLDVIEKTITEKTRSNTIVAEGEKSPSAFLKSKPIKKEMEVR